MVFICKVYLYLFIADSLTKSAADYYVYFPCTVDGMRFQIFLVEIL